MFDWGIDVVPANTWSSLEELAWIEVKSKTDMSGSQSGMLRTSSTDLLTDVTDQSAGPDQAIPNKDYQRSCKRNRSTKHGTFEDDNLKPGYTVQNQKISSSQKAGCYDYALGNTHAVIPLVTSDKFGSSSKGADGKKEIFKYSFGGEDMCRGEDVEFLSEVTEDIRRENLLEFGWGNVGNLEDMDKLFSSTNSILSHDFSSSGGTLWEPLSPTLRDSLGNIHQPVNMPGTHEPLAGEVAESFEVKEEFVTSKTLLKSGTASIAEEWKPSSHDKQCAVSIYDSSLPMQVDNCTSDCNNWESRGFSAKQNRRIDCLESGSNHTVKWKVTKGRRQGPPPKRLEENVQKSIGSQQKVTQNLSHTNSPPLIYMPVIPIAQDSAPSSTQVSWVGSCEPISPVRCLQPVPYVHAGFGFPAHHHLPVVVPSPPLVHQQLQPQGQPVFISYQPQFIESPKLQPSKGTLDVLSQSPTARSTMTPREKIEKLRRRQKMQARLAVEQQQQRLINQRLIPEHTQFGRVISGDACEEGLNGSIRSSQSMHAEPLKWDETSLSVDGVMIEDGDEPVAVSVLEQLLAIATKMDTRTRLCLRDGFCRLARNAMQRRAASDNQCLKRSSSEIFHRSCTADSSSIGSEQCSSQRMLTVDDIVETETNPMDRFIAHLLFHKRYHSPCTSPDVNCTPRHNSEISEADNLHQNGLVWNESNQRSHLSTATRCSSATGEAVILKGRNSIPEVSTSDIPDLCPQQEKDINTVPADKAYQRFVEREIFKVDVGSSVCSTQYLAFSDEVAEPPFQAM